jgi:hypothetical protein
MAELLQSFISPVLVEETFTDSVELSAETRTVGVEPNTSTQTESLSFISLSADQPIDDIVVNTSNNGDNITVSLSGNHMIEIFDQNVILSIPRGSSDLIDTPLTSTGFSEIDSDERQVFKYIVDQRTITVNYALTYTYNFPFEPPLTATDYFTQDVSNDYSVSIPTFLEHI